MIFVIDNISLRRRPQQLYLRFIKRKMVTENPNYLETFSDSLYKLDTHFSSELSSRVHRKRTEQTVLLTR